MADNLPQKYGKYAVTRLLGSGGMASVYAAQDELLDRSVAIKVIHPHLAHDPGFADRFHQEAQLVARLRHPHIVRLYDFDILEDQPFMVMEYLDGGTLKDRLAELRLRTQRMSLSSVALLLAELCGALDYAHKHGAVHRDIKPANIMFTGQDEPVITDFGIAKLIHESIQVSATGDIIGTPAYMSPEQAASKKVDGRSDQYSLAIILFEMVTGRVPFTAISATGILMQHLQEPPPEPRNLNPNLPQTVQQVILRALAKHPDERFESMAVFSQAFSAALHGQSPPVLESTNIGPEQPSTTIAETVATGVLPSEPGQSAPASLLQPQQIAAPQYPPPASDQAEPASPPLPLTRRRPRRRLWIGLSVLAVMAVVLFFAFAGLALLQPAQETSTGGYQIGIADFDNSQASLKVDVARRIYDELIAQLQELEDPIAVQQIKRVLKNAQEAASTGTERGDSMVIWGWYDDLGVSPRIELIENISEAPLAQQGSIFFNAAKAGGPEPAIGTDAIGLQDFYSYLRVPRMVSNFEYFTGNGPQQLAYLTEAILGMAYQVEGNPEQARELFDKAIANATNGEAPGGLDLVYFQRGMANLAIQQGESALADFEHAVNINSKLVEGHYNLAVLYPEICQPERRMDLALQAAESAIALQPEDPDLIRLLASLHGQAGRYAEALEAAQTADQLDPENINGLIQLGDLYTAAGDMAKARVAWDQALLLLEAKDTPDTASLVLLGDVYLRLQRLDDALRVFDQARALNPELPDAFRGLGSAHLQAGDFPSAEKAYLKWVELHPKSALAFTSLGLVYLRQAKDDLAVNAFQTAQGLSTCSTNAWLLLGSLYWERGRYLDAEQAFSQAVVIEPDNSAAHYLAGVSILLQERPADAIPNLEKATALDPTSIEAWHALGTAYYESRRYTDALNAYHQVAEQQPEEAYIHVSLGNTYDKLDQLDQAVAAYEMALQLGESADTHTYLGLVYTRMEDYTKAEQEFRQALDLNPQSSLSQQALGEVLILQGDLQAGAEAYRQALELQENPQLRLRLADLYATLGQLGSAEEQYLQILAQETGKMEHMAAQFGLGQAAYKKCDLDTMSAHYEKTAAAADAVPFPGMVVYAALPAQAAEIRGQIDQADQLFSELNQKFPDDHLGQIQVAEHLMRQNTPESLESSVATLQTVLDKGQSSTDPLSPIFAAIIYFDLGEIANIRGELNSATNYYQQAIDTFNSMTPAILRLGDLSLRDGDAKAAIQYYSEAQANLPAYTSTSSSDAGAVLEPIILAHQYLAYRKTGQAQESEEAKAAAEDVVQTLLARFPDWAQAQFAAGYVALILGEGLAADKFFDMALTCDASLTNAISMARMFVESLP